MNNDPTYKNNINDLLTKNVYSQIAAAQNNDYRPAMSWEDNGITVFNRVDAVTGDHIKRIDATVDENGNLSVKNRPDLQKA